MNPANANPHKTKPGKKSQRVFRNRHLLQIAMPMGGIGAGCICLNGYGGLQDFSIRNAPAISAGPDRHLPQDSGFALIHLPDEGQTRLVEGPFPPEKIFNLGLKSQGYNGGGFEGLPRFSKCDFKGEYPFGTVRLSDPQLPLKVTITGFNPFIPLDAVSSGIPCAILEYELKNVSDRRVPYHFVYSLTHLAQKGAEATACSETIDGLGVFFQNAEAAASPLLGSAAVGILDCEPLIKARWFRGGWFDAVSALWREVTTGKFQPSEGLPAGSMPARSGGSLLVSGELAPGESVTHPVVITWYFPNIAAPTDCCEDGKCSCSHDFHPFYTTQWANAREVLLHVSKYYQTLHERTRQFHNALFSSTLPATVLDAVSANLSVIKSPTVLRYDNGNLWGWEGCFCDSGCCPGSCTHVWNYAQSIPHLFPELERSLREQELENSMDESGHVAFRNPQPGKQASHTFHAAADGQLGGIMKVYRDWLISGDREWLNRLYPHAKRSMDYCIEQWDPRRTGLLEEPHHNTYDIEFWGQDGMCSSFYLGALAAMAHLAQDNGRTKDAAIYAALAQKGANAIDAQLFNGEYYQQNVMFEGLRDTTFVEMLAKISDDPEEEEQLLKSEGPKYQYGSGCLSDGVFGAWLAQLCGLESPQNRENIRSHLQSVYKYNFKPSLWLHANTQRPGFALGDEPGLLLCTWPHGGKPTLPFVYSDEVWTGIEYQVASHMIAEGLVEEGLNLVEAVRSRYDGLKRNPWNEYECGSYYARAMASYALLTALSGFQYSAVTRTLKLAPRLDEEDFRCFFSTASGWGTLTLRKEWLEIKLQEGALAVDTLQITRNGQCETSHPKLFLQAGQRIRVSLIP